jgi:hypothetical protein
MEVHSTAQSRADDLFRFLGDMCDLTSALATALNQPDLHCRDTCFLEGPFPEAMLAELRSLDNFTLLDGWPAELAGLVRHKLTDSFLDRRVGLSEAVLRERLQLSPSTLVTATRIAHVERIYDEGGSCSGVALIENTPLFAIEELPEHSLLLALQKMDLDDHQGRSKLHLHPLDWRGVHLGYKSVFDAEKGQDFLSWEDHGNKHWARPWGDPATDVLSKSTCTSLHTASLAAVQADRKTIKSGMKFAEWSELFERASQHSYVAHPQVLSPTPW